MSHIGLIPHVKHFKICYQCPLTLNSHSHHIQLMKNYKNPNICINLHSIHTMGNWVQEITYTFHSLVNSKGNLFLLPFNTCIGLNSNTYTTYSNLAQEDNLQFCSLVHSKESLFFLPYELTKEPLPFTLQFPVKGVHSPLLFGRDPVTHLRRLFYKKIKPQGIKEVSFTLKPSYMPLY